MSSLCPLCKTFCEDTLHFFFTGERAKEVWDLLGLKHIIADAVVVDCAGSAMFAHLLLMISGGA